MNVCHQDIQSSLPLTQQKSSHIDPDVSPEIHENKKTEELIALAKLLGKLTTHMITSTNALVEKLKPELIQLSILVCEKFLRRKLENPEELQLLLVSILNHFALKNKNSPITISLSPKDYSSLSKWLESQGHVQELRSIAFTPDPSIPRCSCKINTGPLLLYQNLSEELDNLLTLLHS